MVARSTRLLRQSAANLWSSGDTIRWYEPSNPEAALKGGTLVSGGLKLLCCIQQVFFCFVTKQILLKFNLNLAFSLVFSQCKENNMDDPDKHMDCFLNESPINDEDDLPAVATDSMQFKVCLIT